MHRELRDVSEFNDDLEALVKDMAATLYAAQGVGLAANQIGVDLKVFVFDCPDEDEIPHQGIVCNPVLELPEGRDRDLEEADEGCLSLPGAYTPCARPNVARVKGVDHHGQPVEYAGTGVLARCLQHETDHVYGTVFADRLSKRHKKKLFGDAEELAEYFPLDWPVTSVQPPA